MTRISGLDQALLDFARRVYDAIGWGGVLFLMAIESCGVPFPSEIIMPLAGWLLVKDHGLGVSGLLLAATIGAIGNTAGSLAAYAAGAWGGRPLLERYGRYLLVSRHDLDRSDRWFAEYGGWTVFVGRLLPGVRTFVSFPPGIARMRLAWFAGLTFVGSWLWSLGLAAAGYALGQHWERIRAWMRPVEIPIILVAVLVLIWLGVRHVRRALAAGRVASE